MKIFQLTKDPYSPNVNPYIATLMDGVKAYDEQVEFGYGIEEFWDDRVLEYDILHIHWPQEMLPPHPERNDVERAVKRLKELRSRGVKVVVTCHNLKAHYAKGPAYDEIYDVAYRYADVILHMGKWSKKELESKYSQAQHELIPHHTYDTLFKQASREESILKLKLNPERRYILCFGAFRDKEERNIADQIVAHYNSRGYDLLAPAYIKVVKRRNLIMLVFQWMRWKYICLTKKGIHIFGRFVSNDLLPCFFAAADIMIIQRKKILNSGNLPLGFLMGNVVVGPKVGNVGEILEETGNPTFDPDDPDSLFKAVDKALLLNKDCKGRENRLYAEQNFATKIIARKLDSIYKACL